MRQNICFLSTSLFIIVLSAHLISVFDGNHQDVDVFIEDLQNDQEVLSGSKKETSHLHISQPVVEVFVVVDKYVIEFHGNSSIKTYIMTIMKMVSDIYSDSSLGIEIKIIVSRILVFHNDSYNFTTNHNGEKILQSFCEWQLNNQEINSNNESLHDVIVLLTRKDICSKSNQSCGTIGFAYNEGACTRNRKCILVEDTGLSTAYTIAHELGHSLGLTHDNLDNNCMFSSVDQPHIMVSKWPVPIQLPFRWSSCSKKQLIEFLFSYKSSCLWIKSSSENWLDEKDLLHLLPGQIYDANKQCKHHYGTLAEHCTHFKKTSLKTETCSQLWCQTNGSFECLSKGDPAAAGTKCADGMFCIDGQCINSTSTLEPVNGGWSSENQWSVCSRSCGVGVSYTEMLCNNPIPKNGGRYCVGTSRKYKTCNMKPCPLNSVSFRLQQCLQYGNNSMIDVYNQTQPCSLFCRNINIPNNDSIMFQVKVLDGTPCHQDFFDFMRYTDYNEEMNGICVEGQCKKLGCDKQLDSEIHMDSCGVCGGIGDSCRVFEGEFNQPFGRGYVDVANIPQGAMNLLVWEKKPCASFLALKSEHETFSINNHGVIELAGKYNFNKTVVYYLRKSTQEFFYTVGPTPVKIKIMVLFQDFNFGVKYRYTLPLNIKFKNETKKRGLYGWMEGDWEKCSALCGGGVMHQEKPKCVYMHEGYVHVVDKEKCSGAKLPQIITKSCNEQECEKSWFVSDWSHCSAACGFGRMRRLVTCNKRFGNGTWTRQPLIKCLSMKRPPSVQKCFEKPCESSWIISQWSKCYGPCFQVGIMVRNVTCPASNTCSEIEKPSTTTTCINSCARF
ncbi:A disintegrin and metalloproteinase with thrombospondin motifs 7 isoform X1 [Hydra vulgaris]|uniref:A disintegrin and metalloproteinase with thrombospondin motifs 7 isoform X1 n=2 Tax=Hydra vulgaris TaxID=6087 RepID=UPI001F5F3293|nr:A disintegrin and metalloproteinase with thrombospondin motifs 7 isoform X1 [Hydra vulgaris]